MTSIAATSMLAAGPAPAGQHVRPAGVPALASPAPKAAAAAQAAERTLERAVPEAAQAMFPDRAVDVSTFFDEASGRHVYRVADRLNGEVLVQQPAEELLRFYREARDGTGSLVVVKA